VAILPRPDRLRAAAAAVRQHHPPRRRHQLAARRRPSGFPERRAWKKVQDSVFCRDPRASAT
jgi:hypothetical protein